MDGRVGRLACASIGFGLVLSLNAFTLWGVEDLLSSASSWPWAASGMGSLCLTSNVATFLLYGLLAVRFEALSRRRPIVPACVLLIVGGALLLAACAASSPEVPLFQFAGVCLGSGGALAFVCWELTFALLGIGDARRAIVLATAFSTVPYLLLALLVCGDALVGALAGALVPCCALALALAGALVRPVEERPSEREDLRRRQDRGFWGDFWMPLACTMMVGVMGPAIGAFAMLDSMDDALRAVLYQIASLAAAAALALCWFRFGAHPSIEVSFLVLVPVAVVVLFLFPFWSHGYQGFALIFGCFMFSVASILMMMRCIELAKRWQVRLGFVYGFFAAGTYLAQILGRALADIVGTSAYPRQFQVIAVVALLLWGLSAVAIVTVWRLRSSPGVAARGGEMEAEVAERPGESGLAAVSGRPLPAAARPPDPVAARCETLRRAHGLTPREVEVLELMGRGRDVGAIAKILCLSRNTVRTHVQRLYADLGVHTRQELIDLLERTEEASDPV